MKHKEETVDRKKLAFQRAQEGFDKESLKCLLGSKATDDDVDRLYVSARFRKRLRDAVLGTPWHLLGQTIHIIIEAKNIIIRKD